MSQNKSMLTGVFRNRLDADQAFEYLNRLGYRDDEINVLMSDKPHADKPHADKPHADKPHADKPLREDEDRIGTTGLTAAGAGVGGVIGTFVGATAASIAAIGTTLAIPGLGMIVAGPIAAALAGAGVGAIAGGAIGALAGAGVNEQNADAYVAALRDGGYVIGVVPQNAEDAEAIEKRFKEFNGESVCYS